MKKNKFKGWNPLEDGTSLGVVEGIRNIIKYRLYNIVSYSYNKTMDEFDEEFGKWEDKKTGDLYCFDTYILYKFCKLSFKQKDYSQLNLAIELINTNEHSNIIIAAHILKKLIPKQYN